MIKTYTKVEATEAIEENFQTHTAGSILRLNEIDIQGVRDVLFFIVLMNLNLNH